MSPPLRKSTPLQHENLLYLSFPFTYNDYFTESNVVDTPICNKAQSSLFVSTDTLSIKAILKIEILQKLQNIRDKNHIIENVTDISRLLILIL